MKMELAERDTLKSAFKLVLHDGQELIQDFIDEMADKFEIKPQSSRIEVLS